MLKVGKKVPEFKLQAYLDGEFKDVALEDYKGKWLLLFFYPLDFTFICPTEITGFNDHADEFEKLNCKILGGSTDSVHSHKAWAEKEGWDLKYPLFADTNLALSREYGVLVEEEGFALRGTFLIDPDGVLQYMVVHNESVGRSMDETLRVLKAFQTGGLCPVNWKEGDKTLG